MKIKALDLPVDLCSNPHPWAVTESEVTCRQPRMAWTRSSVILEGLSRAAAAAPRGEEPDELSSELRKPQTTDRR